MQKQMPCQQLALLLQYYKTVPVARTITPERNVTP